MEIWEKLFFQENPLTSVRLKIFRQFVGKFQG